MKIEKYDPKYENQLISLLADFRVALSQFKGIQKKPNLIIAKEELKEFISDKYPIFIALDKDDILKGFIVCRVQDNVVWAENLYVDPSSRKKRVASSLYREAEKMAEKLNSGTVFNWVHPNNSNMISFLNSMGYNVLNLIEIRKPYPNELFSLKIPIFEHDFDY